MKPPVADGLMYDPGLIECAEFDWFSVQCLEDAASSASRIRPREYRSVISELPMFSEC